jgi:hypothetical protein
MFGDDVDALRVTLFGDTIETAPEPIPSLREFTGRADDDPTSIEEVLEPGGGGRAFLSMLERRLEPMPDGPERTELAKRVNRFKQDVAEFDNLTSKARQAGVSRETVLRAESPVGAAERSIAQTAVGQTAMAAEQGLGDIATLALSAADRVGLPAPTSAQLHRDKAARDEFLTLAEQGGQIENTLGETGSRVYNNVVRSLTKMAAAGTLGRAASASTGRAAVYSLIGGESFDDALHEKPGDVVYAGQKAAVELAVTYLMGRVGTKLGVHSPEEMLAPTLKAAAKSTVQKSGILKGLAASGLETSEETIISAIQQAIELDAGTREKFDWQSLLEAGLAGAVSGTAANAIHNTVDKLKKLPAKLEETVQGAKAGEVLGKALVDRQQLTAEDKAAFAKIAAFKVKGRGKTGERGLNSAFGVLDTATPELIESYRRPMSQKEFGKVVGIPHTSQAFRETFRDTLDLYARTLEGPQQTSPTMPQDATEASPTTSDPSVAPTPQAAPQSLSEGGAEISGENTAAKNLSMDRDRELLDLPELPDATRRGWQSALETARTNGVPGRASRLAAEIAADPRALSDVETAGMVVRAAELKNEFAGQLQAMQADPDSGNSQFHAAEANRIQEEFDLLSQSLRLSGTEAGRALAARKLTLDADLSLLPVLSRAKAAKGGEALTDAQRGGFEKLLGRLDGINEQIKTTTDSKEMGDLVWRKHIVTREITRRIHGMRPKSVFRHAAEPFHLSRALITSIDFSAVLRQGGFAALSHPIIAAKALPDMFRAGRSAKAAFVINKKLFERPNAQKYHIAKLHLHKDDAEISQREEAFASRLAERIPFVAGSQRAYTTFLNRLRADTFDSLSATLARNGDPTLAEARALANFVNVATGRGGLGKADRALTDLGTVFFAPRYAVSRFQLLLGQPLYGGNRRTRNLIAQEYARYLTGMGLMYALAAAAWGDDENFSLDFSDPTTADFGKIKLGNTRVDPLSGLAQSAVFLSRMSSEANKTVSAWATGTKRERPKFGRDAANTTARFLRTKLAPAWGAGLDVVTGQNVVGEETTPGSLLAGSTVPLSLRDISEAMEDQGLERGTALALLSIFGAGLQTYDSQ